MKKLNKTVSKILFSGILLSLLLLVGSCENWMSSDSFMSDIESEVHDANASLVNVYVRYANSKMGTTEPSGNTTMRVDVASKVSAVTSDDYGFVKWAAFKTEDFTPDKQHKNLIYITEDDYNENYKKYELEDSIVHFSNSTSPSTEVKILSGRNDIFLMPIVAERPSIPDNGTDPKNGKDGVVTNKSIRIIFTKQIDKESLYDEEGNPNFSITSGNAIFTDDEEQMKAKDITNLFDVQLSDSGKMLYLNLKKEKDENGKVIHQELFDIRQTITITLFEDVRDTYGFTMNGNKSFSFTTGTSADDLAPMIEVLYGGIGDKCDVFVTFGEDGEMKGTATKAAKEASIEDIESPEYTDYIFAQRVYDKLNIFVMANDIIASGDIVPNPATDLSEDNVYNIGIAASLYYDKDGNPVKVLDEKGNPIEKVPTNAITADNKIYIPGRIDSESQIKGLFSEVVPKDGNGKAYTSGTVYTYDISSLPDGLIRIDVWGVDMTGNSGGPNDSGSEYFTKQDNGFKSIFVVKDTTPIDSAEVNAKKQVKSSSKKAPYYWYNKESVENMELFDSPENKIHDAGHPKLRALDKNLWWTFKVGNVKEKVLADDAGWNRIHDAESGETSLHYSLSDVVAPEKDGPVDITLYLKDDMDNISDPVLLDSIMYDDTKPTVSLKNDKGDFIKANGEPVQNNSKTDKIEQILKVDFTEDNAQKNVDAVSGIRQMEIHITKNGVEVPAPRNNEFKVLYVPSTVENPTPGTTAEEGLREIQIAENDPYNSNNLVVFDVDDSNKITSGTFFISGLTLGDTDGPWEVSVELYDSALNKVETPATTIMKRDTTPPAIEKIFVNDALKREVYNDSEKDSWWMPVTKKAADGYYNVTFDIYVNETGSGLRFIKLPENVDIDFTENTKLSADGISLVCDLDYSFDSETDTIKMLDEFYPKFINTEADGSKIHFRLEDVKLNINDTASGNRAGIEVEDFVDNIKENKTLTYSDNSTGILIFTDTKAPKISDLRIEDSAKNNRNNPDDIGYNNQYTDESYNSIKYTDEQKVSLLLTLEPETVSGSGVKTVHLSENAEFTSDTEIEVNGAELSRSEWTRSGNKSITFKKVFINADKIKFTNVRLDSTTNGEQFIRAYLTDLAGIDTEVSYKSVGIIYDDKQPEIKNIEWVAPQFVAKGSANGNTVEDQTFKVDFEEVTSGVKVIKFDINYKPNDGEEETKSYEKPFDLDNFEIYYGDKLLIKNTDYIIDGKYIILNTPVFTENSETETFNFKNIKLCDSKAEGNYIIYVTLLDAAENINPQKETEGAVYKEEIVIDTTKPIVEKVQVVGAKKREVYGNPSDSHKWWMPKNSSPNVNLDVTINEDGASIQVIKVSEDVEFTPDTKLYLKKSGYLTENEDYLLDTTKNTIKLLDKYFAKKLIRNDNENQFVLENVKLKNANTFNGNKVALGLEDFVRNEGYNQDGADYKIYFDNNETLEEGTLVYLDSEKPVVAELTIEDSEQNEDNNPDKKGNDDTTKYNYTDDEDVIIILKLTPENDKDGSGVKKVTLSKNAKFAINGGSQIFVNDDIHSLTITEDYKFNSESEVEFTKVFTGNETIKFTNIRLLCDEQTQGEQSVSAKLTDFVELDSEIATSNNTIIYDNVAPRINSIEWSSTDSTVSLINSEKELIDNKTLNIDFTEKTAGIKVIKFDITHDGNTYATPFNDGDFELLYNSNTVADSKYDIDGQYIILKEPKDYKSGIFSFNNLTLNGDNDEGQYIINVTLLDAAENINEQTDSSKYNCKLSIDTTDPVIERVDVLDAIDRTDYSDNTNTSTWWMPADKFETDGENNELSKVDLKVTINEIGSGIRYIKLSEDAEFTDNTVLTRVDSNVTLNKGTDYKLDDNHTIELLNPNNPKLIGTAAQPIVIKLENVKLNKINAAEGNKVKVEVEDFVYHDNSNAVTGGYKIYYDEKDYSGLVVYADYTKPVITTLNIKDSAHDSNVNPDSEGLDLDHYTNNQNVELILTLGAEVTSAGSGVRIIHLENNAKFTTDSEIFVDNVKLASDKYDITESYVDFRNRVFTAANTIRFTNVHMISGDDKHGQTISAKLTDFVGLQSETKESDPITLDQHAPQINNIKWIIPDNSVAEGSVNKEEVTDQTLRVNFTEKTAGVKVIKLDVTYENDTDSYATPFAASQALELYYGDEPLTLGTDYKIEKGRYIVLTQPKTTGVFNIKNIKLKNTALQGDYEIKITLLDAAENVDIKSGSVTVDTTHPVIEKVLVKEAVAREVYNDASNAQKWWMPQSKFTTDGNVDLEITVDEAGSGLKIIQLSQDVELTSATKLVIPGKTIAEGAAKDYVLDTAHNTITINNFDAKLLRNDNSTNSSIVFTLTNVKLKVINSIETGAGNKVAVKVIDFVNNDGTNEISGSAGNYKIFYPDGSDGTLIFADLTKPEITNLRMEDSEQNTENNSENKGTDKTKYTDSQNVVVYLTLKAETLSHGSGVKKITLTDNAVFTDTTEIFVDGTPLTTGITWAADKKSVEFDKVFIAANVIKLTNVNLISDENKADQTISAKLTDFVENITENAFVSETITLDTHAPVINSIIWHSDDATVSLTNSQSNEIRNKSLKINFTDTNFGSGVKVIRFDIEHNGVSYTTPFGLTYFSLDYDGTVLTKGTDYTIDGRYIILTTSENYKSGVFTFNNLKLNDTPAEGKYVVNVTLLDAAENKNAQTESSVYNKSLSIDTTDPVIASVQVLDSVSRIDYSDSTNGITWWMPSSKFDAEGNLTAVDLKLTINEIGSGIRFIKLSEDVEYTENTLLKLIENDIESTLVEGTDYTLNQQTRTIELLDHDNAKLNGTESNPSIVIKLENVKLNKINSAAGNKIAVKVEDFVYHPTTNKIANTTSDYQISYADGTTGKVVYADYTAPSIADLRIEDSAQNENNNPENIGYNNQYTSETDNTKKYTDSRDVVLLLKLTSEKLTNGSGIKTVKLSSNATFTEATHIYVDGTELASTGFTFASDYKSVNFTKVFTQANTLKFTNVQLGSGTNGDQTISTDLTDFVGNNTTSSTTSVAITYDSAAPVITAMAWEAESSAIALGHAFNQNVSNQILRVDFTELTAGTKVIKFDIDHEGTGSYATPFALTSFKLKYGDTELTKGTDYTINGRYIILKEPKTSGTFRFSNIQISNTAIPEEGRYNIKVTLLDAAENINPQESGNVYSWPISVDTTAPAIQKVQVLGAESRIDYSNAAAGVTWWMPASKFDSNGNLNKVALKFVIKEAGSGLRNIKLSQDVQFTSATILKKIVGETESALTAGEGHDYILHTDTNTIELLNHQNPILKGTETEFVVIKLENVQLNNINASAGNKIAVELEDFVYHTKTNETSANSGNYTITYPDDTTGTLVYADYTAPVISELRIEDSKQEQDVNPDTKGVNQEVYTNDQNVNLVLNLDAESSNYGSGVKIISLTNNATFTTTGTDAEITKIFVDGVELSASDYTLNSTNVNFGNKVFTAANVIKFTNVNILNGDDKTNQTIKVQLTDFVGLSSAVAADAIVFDRTPASITSIEWVAPNGVAKGSANTNEVTDQTLKVAFTEETAGVKVIKFDVTYDGDPENAASYDAPFSMANFKLYYGETALTSEDYTIESGRYIVLTNPRLSGSFSFENLKLRNASAEGEYNIKITLLDAAENKNAQTESSIYNKKIFIDTTVPVVEKVLIEDAQKREVYNDSSNTKLWWMPSSKFDSNGDLTKLSLQITVNEAGSGLKVIKLDGNAEFTSGSILKKGSEELTKGTDYVLDTTENTITLLDYEDPELRGSSTAPSVVFTLENVKLNNINDAAGNKVAVTVEDFVTNPGSNRIGQAENYKIFYPDNSDGTLIFADFQNPAITALAIEDSAHNTVTNPDNKAWDKDNYTDSQDVTLILTLAAEDTDAGSGVKVITLTDNAEFTDDTAIYVDGTELTTGITWATNKKSVEFSKVFIAANVIKFTNVKLPATEGTYSVKANLKDFAGWNATTDSTSNPIMLDTSAPAISEIKWMRDDTTVTEGTTNTAVVANQSLNVVFTEAVSGVKVIKLDITSENNNTPYATPFADDNFILKCGNTELTDYSVDGKYIILNNTEKTNNFNFHGIKIADTADECVYTIKVTLLDAAENNVIDTKTISIDVTNPEIDGNLRIHDLIRSVELTTDSTVTEKYWLPKAYINASVTTGQAPASIPVYLTIKERTSGIKIFEFSEDVVLTENTKLYKIDSNAADETSSDARTLIPADGYDINDAHTIKINNEVFAKENFAKKNDSNEEDPFIILVDNIGFANADSSSEVSENSITITLSDVAKNVSNTATTAQTNIYSDSIAPDQPTLLTLVDRHSAAADSTIEAFAGYTNESIVNMTFSLGSAEVTGSGYHKFELTDGATFIASGNDKTQISMKVGTAEIQNLDFEISNDGKTLTLKKDGEINAVVNQAVNVTFSNIQLASETNASHSVSLKVYDRTGWESATSSASITLDTEKPEIVGGAFTANYSDSDASYYKPAVNVFPHPNGETAYGSSVNYGTTTSPKLVPTFYTATTYFTGRGTENGQVKVNYESDYGAVLGFRATDNIRLLGYSRSTTFLYYCSDTNFNKTAAEIISSSSNNPASDRNGKSSSTQTGNSATSSVLNFGIQCGRYSAVVVDEAGNVSDVFRFAVVKDTAKPNVTGMQNRVLLMRPDESSNVYRNATAVVSTTTDFADFKAYNSSSTLGIKNLKYVTKIAENKYKIILNLGSGYTSSNLVSKINGESTSSVTGYEELNATKTSAPIESYAISTWYGSWPTALDSTVKFTPVVPYATTFPSGEELKPSARNDSLALMACNYFGGDSTFQSYWRMYWSDQHYKNGVWPLYSHDNGVNEDKVNKINSYVDENNNLVIELPQTSTAPISVFLRDGCGNMDYVVCGLDEDSNTAISYIVDDKLGPYSTDKGVAVSPKILQFPYSAVSSTEDMPWDGYNFKLGAQSANSEAPSSQKGTGEQLGFIKDWVKHATYYNPNLSYSDKTRQFKHGFALHFFDNEDDRNVSENWKVEDITFDDDDTIPEKGSKKASATEIDEGKYTCRVLLYCTDSTTVPTYKQIVDTLTAENNKSSSEKTGQVTDWTYIRVKSSVNEAIVLVDYPQPNLKKLGWTTNDSNHEPVPYYMWYIFEDRVGNYDIGKVVNSVVSGDDLREAPSATSSDFDKWLYDGEKPKLTIRNTTTEPNQVGKTQEDVSKLVATNNGYVPYLDGTTIWVSSDYDREGRDSSLLNENVGWGTTHEVEYNSNSSSNKTNRRYMPFADLVVDEITGIRAFCWTNSATPPSYTYVAYDGNTQGDSSSNKWYAGYNVTSYNKDIGVSWIYGGNSTNAYFRTGNYASTYSGTKVNTILPPSKMSSSTEKELYLHVMDWTGNISSYRMGQSLVFKNDTSTPTWNKDKDPYGEDEHYYVTDQLKVVIAGNEAGSAARHETMKVYMPKDYFSDTGSGFAGFVFGGSTTLTVNDVTKDGNGKTYLEIPYSEYSKWPTNGKDATTGEDYLVEFYCFDNVGNSYNNGVCKFTGVRDTNSPDFDTVSFVTKASSDTEFIHEDTTTNPIKPASGSYGKVTDYKKRTASKHDSIFKEDGTTSVFAEGEVQELWVNKSETSKFHVNMKKSSVTDEYKKKDESSYPSDFAKVVVNKWDCSEWKQISSTASGWTSSSNTSNNPPLAIYSMGASASSGYNILSDSDANTTDTIEYTTSGTYYQIDVSDLAGNHSYQYFKIILDDQGPTVVARTDATTTATTATIALGKGSINALGTGSNKKYYYTADSSHNATIKFAITDDNFTGKGIKNSAQKLYYSFDPDALNEVAGTTTSKWTEVTSPIDGTTNVSGTVASGDLDKIYLKDILGNTRTVDVDFNYDYTNGAGNTGSQTISKLYFYGDDANEGAPAKPTFSINNVKTSSFDYPNNYYTNKTKMLDNSTDTVLITSKDRKQLQISFTKPNDNIIGYLVTDESGNIIPKTYYTESGSGLNKQYIQNKDDTDTVSSIPSDHPDDYSFNNSLQTSFVETLPLLLPNGNFNSNYQAVVTRKYYAVDIVGNISEPLVIKYTFRDPNKAENITLMQSINDVTDATVKSDMQSDGISFANFYVNDTDMGNKNGNVFFNNDYIVLRCTLPEVADSSYNETPKQVELIDVWGNNSWSQATRATSYSSTDNTDSSIVFKVYPTTTKDSNDCYYCYIAFKIKDNFDNNDSFGGSVIHARVYGKTSAISDVDLSTGFLKVGSLVHDDNYGWQIDKNGPSINNDNFFVQPQEDNVKKIKGYVVAESPYNTKLTTIPTARDNNVGPGYESNVYKSGTAIFLQVRQKINGNNYNYFFKDDLTVVAKYKIVTCDGFAATTPSYDSSWKIFGEGNKIFDSTGYYKFELDDITTPHKHLALFLADAVGNVSEPYYLVNKDSTAVAWWITDNNPQNVRITMTKDGAEVTPEFVDGTTQYVLNVAMDPGAVIKTITADNATITDVEFNDYNQGGTPTFDPSTGKFANEDNWLNISGMKVTINVVQSWNPKSVTIKFNNSESVTFENFVPAFTLTKQYITTQGADWEYNKRSGYEVFVELKDGPTAGNISSITANNATVDSYEVVSGTENKKVKVTLKNVAAQDWGKDQTVTLRINNSFNTDAVLTVPKIAPEHIGINTLTWDDGTPVTNENGCREFTVNITIPDEASAITGVSTSNVSQISSDITSSPATVTFKAYKGWIEKTPKLVITGSYNDGQSTKPITVSKNVFTIAPIEKSDLSISLNPSSYVEGTTEYELTVNVPANVGIPDGKISAENADIEKLNENSVNKYKLTVSPDYGEKVVSVTVQDFEPFGNVLTVTPKALEEGDITIWDAVWNTEKSQYESSISFRTVQSGTGPSMANVISIALDSETNGNAEIERSGTTITYKNLKKRSWDDQYVTLIVNGNAALKFENVLTIPKLTAENITYTNPSYESGTTEYVLDISVTDDAALTNDDFKLTTQDGTELSTTIATGSYNANNKKYTLNVTPAWVDTDVYLKIKSFEPRKIFTVTQKSDEAKANDIKLTFEEGVTGWSASKTSYVVTISDVPVAITSVAKAEGSAPVSIEWNEQLKTATLTEIKQSWEDKDVILSINGIAKKIFTVGKLGRNAITIKQGENAPAYDAETTVYVLDISVTDNAELTTEDFQLTDSTGTGLNSSFATGSYNAGSKEYTLNVTPIWENKKVYLKIKAFEPFEIFEVTKKKFTTSDFELGNATQVEGESGKYTIPVTLKNGAPVSEIENVSADHGANTTLNKNDETVTVTVENLPNATWSDQTITLTFNKDSEGKNGIDKVTDVVVPAKRLQASDIELGTATKQDDGSYTIDVTFGENIPASAIKKVATDMEEVTGVFEKTSAESVTPETGKITLTGVPEASWTNEYKIKLVINEGAAQFTIAEPVIVIAKKTTITADNVLITDKDENPIIWETGKYKDNTNIDFKIIFTNDVPNDCTIKTTDGKLEVSCSNGANAWNSSGNNYGINGSSYPENMTITINTKYGKITKNFFTPAPEPAPTAPENGGNGVSNGSAGTSAGFLSGIISRITGSSSESSSTYVETDKTRSITIPNWVTDELNTSDLAEKVSADAAELTKKAAKKAKKAEKTMAAKVGKAPVEKPVITETVESVAVTSVATVREDVEAATETVANAVTVEEVTPEAKVTMPVVNSSVTESVVEDSANSGTIFWLALAVLCAAVAGVVVLIFKNRDAKK